jgi:hypothetical protein
MSLKWVPIFGEFEIKKDTIVFKGKLVEAPAQATEGTATETREAPAQVPAIGTIVCNQQITDGTVSAEVTFEEVGPSAGCELILGMDVETRGFISAGINGSDYALFSIRQWFPGTQGSQAPTEQPRWIPFSLGGDRGFLRKGRPYAIEASIRGSRVSLHIDDVLVATTSIRDYTNKSRQVGLWCLNTSGVTVRNFRVDAEKPRAFVVMHFAKPYDEVYSEVLRSVCAQFGLETIRADEIYGPGVIVEDIVDQILRAQVVIADITPQNPNVYFEVGYALAWSKPMILLARLGTQLPFDVSGFRVLFYEDSIAGKSRLEEGLVRHLRSALGAT